MKTKVLVFLTSFLLITTNLIIRDSSNELANNNNKEDKENQTLLSSLLPSPPADWPMFHRTEDSKGYTPENGPNTQTLLWTKSLQANVVTSPAVVNGKVYTYSFKGSQRGFLCLDAQTGSTIWQFNVTSGSICSAPAVVDNKVYIGTNWGSGDFYCLDANSGSLIWEKNIGSMYIQGPVVFDNIVYISTSYDGIYALNATNGAEIWWCEGGAPHTGVAVESDYIIIGDTANLRNGWIKALNRFSGTTIWSFACEGIHSTPTIAYDKVYVQAYYGNLYALNFYNGTMVWHKDLGTDIWNLIQSSPGAGYNKIFVGAQKGGDDFFCFDADSGASIWSYELTGSVISSPVISGNGIVYIASSTLYALDVDDGSLIWSQGLTGSEARASPAIYNEVIYIPTPSVMYAIGEYEEPPSDNQPPVAEAGANQIVDVGDIVYFDGSSSYDPDDTIIKYEWDFGDGSIKKVEMRPRHIYNIPGNYIVTLTVTDNNNATDTDSCIIAVLHSIQPPMATAGSDQTVNEKDVVQFDGSNSYDPEGSIVSYQWDFDAGDGIWWMTGSPPDATGPTPTHVYGDDGEFTVTLRVTDSDNLSATDTCNITVQNVDPTVTIESAIMNVDIGLRVGGRKYNNVSMILYEGGAEISRISIERLPGSPNEQMKWIPSILNMEKEYSATVSYEPMDPPNVGGNPVWIYIKFENGTTKRIHHTFNVQQSKKKDSEHWNHVEPWEVDLNAHLIGCSFDVSYYIKDPGSDDETLTFIYGSQTLNVTFLNNPPNPDPYPSPDVNPVDLIDIRTLIYEGQGTLSLKGIDDDDGKSTVTISIM